jgi:hypothetical protein
MRLLLVLAPLLLAGCAERGGVPPPPAAVPPSLLIDRAGNDTLQVFVHAKQGNTRYAHLDLAWSDNTTGALGPAERRAWNDTYAFDVALGTNAAALLVQAQLRDVGQQRYYWNGSVALNLSAAPPTLRVLALPLLPGAPSLGPAREQQLPFETLLQQQERFP